MANDWIPWGAGVVVSAVSWVVSWRIASAKSEGKTDAEIAAQEEQGTGLRQDIRDLRDDVRAGLAEMRTQATNFTALQASQDKVNVYTAEAIKAIVSKQERQEEKLNDHAAALRLLTELVTRDRKQ
jgi:hypothetical protein